MGVADTAAWGAVASLVFLIVAVAYRALAGGGPAIAALLAVAVVVGVAGAAGARAVG
ncbi:hypothetical protein [Halarchaeum nitratireducens]|uniref:Uncharacterized protein n=1 Tax=Halarchaeum nitratireducens TaxID=489913 RepID=A0A830G9N3_9EURY|nr:MULTISPECIES: hypothetical protein [Halarchaeum]MBP2250357.1 putative RND superfamily exporter protein [Halarchaeum solikamskense]GGN12917.1 hypothetical protein GCM10009021_11370 [Halarchaeum nitratireducens]